MSLSPKAKPNKGKGKARQVSTPPITPIIPGSPIEDSVSILSVSIYISLIILYDGSKAPALAGGPHEHQGKVTFE